MDTWKNEWKKTHETNCPVFKQRTDQKYVDHQKIEAGHYRTICSEQSNA